MTHILALTKQQSDLLQKEMPENVVQLQDTGNYILTSITLTDSVDMLKLFQAGIIHGLNLTK
jgi:hypothetical protein